MGATNGDKNRSSKNEGGMNEEHLRRPWPSMIENRDPAGTNARQHSRLERSSVAQGRIMTSDQLSSKRYETFPSVDIVPKAGE